MPSNKPSRLFDKYRELSVAIALFLVLDLGVLVSNYYTSGRLQADAAKIALAGDLRGYSQQLTKAILTLDQQTREDMPVWTSLAEIRESRLSFADALVRLSGTAELDDPEALSLRNRIDEEWKPLDRTISPLLAATPDAQMVEIARNKVVGRNIRIMVLADDLGKHLRQRAEDRAGKMRAIQIAAVLLATLNFIFIIFKFLRRLRASDTATENARKETARILDTVREGLFLVHADRRVGRQRSRSLDQILPAVLGAQDNLCDYLARILPADVAEAGRDYIDLLFNPKVKPSLLESLNPLHEVPVRFGSEATRGGRHLSFDFWPITEAGQVTDLLVSVRDVSRQVQLAAQLEAAEDRASKDVGRLLEVLDQDPVEVGRFLQDAQQGCNDINMRLRDVKPISSAYRDLITHTARSIHGLKGRAALLSMDTLVRAIHGFEDTLSPLRNKPRISGDDLIPIAVALSEVIEEISAIQAIVHRVKRFATTTEQPVTTSHNAVADIERLALSVANALSRKVRFEADIGNAPENCERTQRVLREVMPHLVRNAIAHGIEPENERRRLGKPPQGLLKLSVCRNEDGSHIISLTDDGRGIDLARLRQKLIATGRYSAEKAEKLDSRQLLAHLFSEGLSSLDTPNEHAGRGDGLPFIQQTVRQLGGRLRVQSSPNRSTTFTLHLANAA